MTHFIYNKYYAIVCEGYEKGAEKAMKNATKEKAELAISSGNVDVDGTPLITVVVDSSWCKRSYKTMYN